MNIIGIISSLTKKQTSGKTCIFCAYQISSKCPVEIGIGIRPSKHNSASRKKGVLKYRTYCMASSVYAF